MFDIGFGELIVVMIIALVVLGPERLPVAIKTVMGWIRTLRSLSTTVQMELTRELKLQELQESLKKVEKAGIQHITPELKSSMEELKQAAEAMQKSYHSSNPYSDTLTDSKNVRQNENTELTPSTTDDTKKPNNGDNKN